MNAKSIHALHIKKVPEHLLVTKSLVHKSMNALSIHALHTEKES